MSTYLRMWAYVKTLSRAEALAFLAEHAPATGANVVLPDGTSVVDIDVLEAVRYCLEHDRL